MDRSGLLAAPADDLHDTIGQLNALEQAIRSAKLRAIAAYDERELWLQDASTSMSTWLSALTGEKQQTAKEEVRVAHALRKLPHIAALYEEGNLSWDHVAALTRFATPTTDAQWASQACGWTAMALEREARRHERTAAEPDETADPPCTLRGWWTSDRRSVKLNGELPPEEGAGVLAALQRRAEQQPRNADTNELEPYERRMAQALVELAGISIANDADPDRATVVLHVSELALACDGPGLAELESGAQLRLDAIRRMVCDGRVEFAIENALGRTVGIGRCSRKVPAWLERQVLLRDLHCRFPGCNRTTLLHCHHAIHWLDGGPTDLWNLVELCGTHHRVVHKKGWRVIALGDGRFRFVRPDGLAVPSRPPRLRPEIRERFFGTRGELSSAAPFDTS